MSSSDWARAISLAELEQRGKAVVKLAGKQILVLHSNGTMYACNNRCPHEGFPLAEGTLSDGCILTCNWHSWRFNLEDGETLIGGDALRRYDHEIRDGEVWLDVSDPPAGELRARALAGLRAAFGEHDYERIARELARFERAGGDPHEALVHAFTWAMDGLEFGTTHAHAAAPDWLSLRDGIAETNAVDRQIPLTEIIGHLSWDVLMQNGPYPFANGPAPQFDEVVLEDAIEAEDEATAVAQARAGLAAGGAKALRPVLERAALRHYQNFGHSVIYVDKVYELIARLGPAVAAAVVLPLVRSLCNTAREDLIPEFKAYEPALAAWTGEGTAEPDPNRFRNTGVAATLKAIAASSANVPALYDALMYAAADQMLHFDARYRHHTDKPVQHNIDWLDFTHAVTHLSSARKVCARQPGLWANALLQTGCFLGRNTGFVDWQQDTSRWAADETLLDDLLAGMLDHGEPLYIYPAHTLKLTTAVREELALNPEAPWKPVMLAAINRYANEPAKKKHMRRAITQARNFVALEG